MHDPILALLLLLILVLPLPADPALDEVNPAAEGCNFDNW